MPLLLNQPPSMRVLMTDEYFRGMMRRRPRIPSNLTRPGMSEPWHLWALMTNDRWKRGRFHTYDEAYAKLRSLLKNDGVADVSITSIRYMMPPPIGFKWQWQKYPWCARCRRPSLFFYKLQHRAINFEEINADEPMRCYFCGIRQAALPRYSPR